MACRYPKTLTTLFVQMGPMNVTWFCNLCIRPKLSASFLPNKKNQKKKKKLSAGHTPLKCCHVSRKPIPIVWPLEHSWAGPQDLWQKRLKTLIGQYFLSLLLDREQKTLQDLSFISVRSVPQHSIKTVGINGCGRLNRWNCQPNAGT